MTGISAYGAYVPQTRLALSAAAGRPAKEGAPERAVAYYDEDAVTMGVAAAVDCLRGVARESIDSVIFASTTYPLREKAGASLIAKALDLPRAVRTRTSRARCAPGRQRFRPPWTAWPPARRARCW